MNTAANTDKKGAGAFAWYQSCISLTLSVEALKGPFHVQLLPCIHMRLKGQIPVFCEPHVNSESVCNCRVKLELRNYYQNQTTEWAGTSNSTTELAERLQHAKQLVQGLGLQAISNWDCFMLCLTSSVYSILKFMFWHMMWQMPWSVFHVFFSNRATVNTHYRHFRSLLPRSWSV